jgi:hypothetical protein
VSGVKFNDAIFPHVELNAVILILLSSTDEAMPPLWSFVVGLQSIDEIVIDAKTWAMNHARYNVSNAFGGGRSGVGDAMVHSVRYKQPPISPRRWRTVCSGIKRWEVQVVEAVGIVLVTWGLYLLPFLLVAGVVWFFGQKRVKWNRWDFSVIVLPFAVWALAMMIPVRDKSLSNLVEAFWLGCAAPLSPVVRVMVGQKVNQNFLAIGLLVTVCLAAIGLWAFVPGLPE